MLDGSKLERVKSHLNESKILKKPVYGRHTLQWGELFMKTYLVLAAMNGQLLAESGNIYENFQLMGYVDALNHENAIITFFNQPHFPVDWVDVIYLWAESLENHPNNGHYGKLHAITSKTLMNESTNISW